MWTIFSLHDFIVCLVPLTPFHPHLLWKGYDAGDNIPHASHEAVNFWYFYVKRKFVSFDINLKNGAYSLSLYDDWIGPDHERRGSLLPPTPPGLNSTPEFMGESRVESCPSHTPPCGPEHYFLTPSQQGVLNPLRNSEGLNGEV